MITKEQAITVDRFHQIGSCKATIGPNGGIKHRQVEFRRNGQTQTWVTRPEEFRIPVKYGLSGYGQIREWSADQFVAASECPVCSAVNDYYVHKNIDTLRATLAELKG